MKLNEEEKKAIEMCEEDIRIAREYYENEDDFKSDGEYNKVILLNLIEKQQKENKELQNTKNNCPAFNTSGVSCKIKASDYIPKEDLEDIIENCAFDIKSYLTVIDVEDLKELLEEEQKCLIVMI